MNYFKYILLFLILSGTLRGQSQEKNQSVFISGKVIDRDTKLPLKNISVRINNSTIATETDKKGIFEFFIPKVKHVTLLFSNLNYKKEIKEIEVDEDDTIRISVSMKNFTYELPIMDITSKPKPDTVFGTQKFSIIDFDFFEDKYFLLTIDRKTDKPFIRLADEAESILHSLPIPEEAGKIKDLYHDFMGYTNIMCEKTIYRLLVRNDKILLAALPVEDYNALVKPIIDTVNSQLLFSNYSKDYPLFNYFSYNMNDSTKKEIHTVEDAELMHAYRFEYYSLKTRDKLIARDIEREYGVDKHIAAAMISGFTQSLFYTPLYAPLYIISDTICVFDHYKDCLFHYNNKGIKIDSVKINYHHPKNWKEWKRMMLKDFTEDKIYAVYDNSGHKYLKKINTKNGKDEGKYPIIHYSADKIRIRDGYIYYVYRPFGTMQEKYLYKEKILLDKK
ncbi:MAG: carboxypeptidase-like regulatory domain-containing protein [Bacteroidota bacterium]|nr:carboxypeptidase-like regulatory domain-containing protein [Bacteroidota bacterium]